MAFWALLAASTLVSGVRAGDGPPALTIRQSDGLLTLDARDRPLIEVLAAIADHCDLVLVSNDPLDTPLTVRAERQLPHDLLRQVLRDQSYLLQATDGGSGCGATLWVFADGASPRERYLLTPPAAELDSARNALAGDDSRAKRSAIRKLRASGDSAAISLLSEAMLDDDPRLRIKAIQALVHIGGEDALAALTAGLGDPEPQVRGESAIALGSLGNEAALPALSHALGDADSRVREAAIRAIREVGGDSAAETLAIAFYDSDKALRVAAVEALADVDGAAATYYLEEALRADDTDLREAAGEAMDTLKSRR